MAWPAAIAALGGTLYSAQQAKSRAKDQMSFQRDMSNTAYQRAMADLKQAGINPIMVSKLGGASTPTGAMAPTPDFGSVGEKTAKTLATAKQIQLFDAQTRNTNEQSKVHSTTADLNSAKSLVETQKARTEQLIQQEKRANIEGKKIANTLALQTQQYFKKLGYPPQVLTARWQNIAGTFLWENLDDRNKNDLVRAINAFATKSTSNAKKFIDDPIGVMESIMKGLF
jgi:hypothetical protein